MNAAHPSLSLLDAINTGMSQELANGAACGADPELHTGPNTATEETAQERAAREQVAKEVCRECPVRSLCLARALGLRPETGVWAGYTADRINALANVLATFDAPDFPDFPDVFDVWGVPVEVA